MKEKLQALLKEAPLNCRGYTLNNIIHKDSVEAIADHLLESGVIVPQFNVGDTVYIPDQFGRIDAEIERIEITERGLCYEWVKYDRGVDETEVWDDGSFEDADIGKTVFPSFEDYEKALAEREGKG